MKLTYPTLQSLAWKCTNSES